jgi:hypothetical protein
MISFSDFEKFIDGVNKTVRGNISLIRLLFMISLLALRSLFRKLTNMHSTDRNILMISSFTFEKFVDGNNKTVRGMQVFVHDKFLTFEKFVDGNKTVRGCKFLSSRLLFMTFTHSLTEIY